MSTQSWAQEVHPVPAGGLADVSLADSKFARFCIEIIQTLMVRAEKSAPSFNVKINKEIGNCSGRTYLVILNNVILGL